MPPGVACGFWQFVQLNPVDGDHTKLPVPVALKNAVSPAHMVCGLPASTIGMGLTVTATSSVAAGQTPLEMVTV